MGRQLVLISLLAGAVAVLVGIGVHLLDDSRGTAPTPVRAELGTLLVARERIPVGTRLTADVIDSAVRVDKWPADALPDGTIQTRDEVRGHLVKSTIHAGEPVFRFKLDADGKGSLPMLIEDGMRAFTVRVDDVTGVSGFIVPESYVDVIGTFKNVRHPIFGQRRGATFSRTILEHVKVLAAGSRIDDAPDEEEGRRAAARGLTRETTVTLLVTPAQAEVLALAEQEGTVHLALRSYEDDDVVAPPGISQAELLGFGYEEPAPPEPEPVEAPEPAAEPEPPSVRVEVIKGNERSAVTF